MDRATVVSARLLVALSVVLLAARLWASTRLGFGDAEALYATYALHPQPAYLDHPGLIGSLARLLGGGGAPSPLVAHVATALAATAVPFVAVVAAWLSGATLRASWIAGLALVATPEIAIGLFGLTPDLPLSIFWLAAVGAMSVALASEVGSALELFAFLAFGAASGLAIASKASGALLPLGAVLALAARPNRRHLRSVAPWLGLALMTLFVLPVVRFEAQNGFPMLRHRFVDTQAGAGFSVRNVGALVGGQLAYVSPFLLASAVVVAVDLFRRDRDDPIAIWLRAVTATSFVALGLLCLWSRVAEPHWLAPAFLALPIHAARAARSIVPRKLAVAALATGVATTAIAHVWVLSDLAPRRLGSLYVARYDLANDLYAWGPAVDTARAFRDDIHDRFGVPPVFVAPHWTIASQLAAGLDDDTPVATTSAVPDDFRTWAPPEAWRGWPVVVWVSDDRFDLDPPASLGTRVPAGTISLDVKRGGRVVRRIRLVVLFTRDAA